MRYARKRREEAEEKDRSPCWLSAITYRHPYRHPIWRAAKHDVAIAPRSVSRLRCCRTR